MEGGKEGGVILSTDQAQKFHMAKISPKKEQNHSSDAERRSTTHHLSPAPTTGSLSTS